MGAAVGHQVNPPLHPKWVTPKLLIKLSQVEDRLIRNRIKYYGTAKDFFGNTGRLSLLNLLICDDAVDYALDLLDIEAQEERGQVNWPGQADWPIHTYIRVFDGSIIDVAARQFGHRGPLIIPAGHPLQARYVPI